VTMTVELPAAPATTAPSGATARSHPPLRQLPVPCCEPPYDDELDPLAWPSAAHPHDVREQSAVVQGTLALSFLLPSGVPAAPETAPTLRLVGRIDDETADTVRRSVDPDDFGPQPSASELLPPARSWAGRVVQAIVEVLAGVRPVGQLVRWTTADVYDEIANLVIPGPRLPDCGPPRGVVRSVHVTEPADGVAEVCALVRRGARSTAVALRLEGMDGRWQCTALELG
jgi:hypothetical protein